MGKARDIFQGWGSILAHPVEAWRGLRELFGWARKGDVIEKPETSNVQRSTSNVQRGKKKVK